MAVRLGTSGGVDLPLLTSPLLPVPHGFTTRVGGVSEPPWNGLNFGLSVGDAPTSVEENFARLAGRLGMGVERFLRVSQVHGVEVCRVADAPASGAGLQPPAATADGVWTGVPGLAPGVLTADCVPLLLVDPVGGRVAAVHSGWKGSLARIARNAVDALTGAGGRPDRLLAAIGPCIRPCCYQVEAELGQRFSEAFGVGVAHADGRTHARLDLVEAVRRTLLEAGVAPGHVDALQACSACEPERFFSHRRDGARTGRMFSFVVNGG